MSRREQRGQIIVWVAVMVPLLFLPIVGLTMDAGVIFDGRRGLQNMADGAARVGAMEINQRDLHDNATGTPHLNPDDAESAARRYLRDSGYRGDLSGVRANQDRIIVSIDSEVHPTFLTLVHVRSVTIHANSRATPCAGVTSSGASCTS